MQKDAAQDEMKDEMKTPATASKRSVASFLVAMNGAMTSVKRAASVGQAAAIERAPCGSVGMNLRAASRCSPGRSKPEASRANRRRASEPKHGQPAESRCCCRSKTVASREKNVGCLEEKWRRVARKMAAGCEPADWTKDAVPVRARLLGGLGSAARQSSVVE